MIETISHTIELSEHNLKVTHYRNGDQIRHAQSDEDWIDAGNKEEGAYCISSTGGYLYNWYAVNDQRGLAPKGWKIPSDDDWSMIDDNHSLRIFDGLRNYNGLFYYHNLNAFFWSSSQTSSSTSWFRFLYYDYLGIYRNYVNKKFGLFVRCIKEEE